LVENTDERKKKKIFCQVWAYGFIYKNYILVNYALKIIYYIYLCFFFIESILSQNAQLFENTAERQKKKKTLFQLWAYGFREKHSILVKYALKRIYYMDLFFF
jgi:succinate dehydrogenase flavin-adding protein (antitoxin of CptAB toxin-antitoxin module)